MTSVKVQHAVTTGSLHKVGKFGSKHSHIRIQQSHSGHALTDDSHRLTQRESYIIAYDIAADNFVNKNEPKTPFFFNMVETYVQNLLY